MDYIFKPEFLNLNNSKQSINLQYYHWVQKKRLQKQKSEHQSLVQQWYDICQEEQKEKKKQQSKSSKHRQKQRSSEQISKCGPQDLYKKNVEWKHNIDMKVAKIRMQQKQQLQRQQQTAMNQSISKQPLFKNHYNYKGPIKAWKQRFDNYLKTKSTTSNQEEQGYFHPQINRNSRLITSKMTGKKVQDRLLEYGQKLKQKKAVMQIIYQEQLFVQRNVMRQQCSDDSLEEVYFRLYKDGQKYNKKRNEYKSTCTFMPEINKNSIILAEKISQKRKPLYPINIKQNHNEPQKQQKQSKQSKQKNFIDFLKRNEVLLKKIQKCKQKKQIQLKQKQIKQIKECTFKPNLNQKSMKIISNKSNQKWHKHQQSNQNSNQFSQDLYKNQNNLVKKIKFVKSEANDFIDLNKQLQTTQRQRISRLNSHGHIYPKNQGYPIYIGQQDSISNINNYQQYEQHSSLWHSIKKKTIERQQQKQPSEGQLFAEDCNGKTEIYDINEVVEEDSIQRCKQDDWQKQLMQMQRQIEDMMQRTPTK